MKFTKRMESRRRAPARQSLVFESLEMRTLLAGDPILDGQPLIISEFVADSNSSLLTRTRTTPFESFEGLADSPDWIELLNVSRRRLDVSGMHLTDDPAARQKWQFPSGTSIDAGGYLTVFASGDDISDPTLDENGFLHTNFRLAGDGDYLALTDREGIVTHEFSPSYPEQRTDVSYAAPMDVRLLVGADTPLEYLVPTDDSLAAEWQLPGFTHAHLIDGGDSPIGYDVGGEDGEPGETIGADPVDRASSDFSRGSIVVLEGSPFTEAGRVAEWSFFSDKTRSITPLILRASDGEFEITGIGSTRVSDGSGTQSFSFDVQFGDDTVEPNEYFFGYKDGDNEVDEAGVVVYDRSDADLIRRYNGPLSGSLAVGQQLSEGREFTRTYSVQAVTQARLAGPINTNVESAMAGVTSLYVRYPFAVEQIDALRSLSLRVRYDDAIVAYLNGVEVARRNLPDAVQFDSTAASSRSIADANQFEPINVSAFIGELNEGENVLAIHGFNDASGGADFLVDVELVGINIESLAEIGFASDPTPGRANGAIFRDFVPTVSFSHERGFYEAPFFVVLSTPATPQAVTYFTLDGTAPSPDNPSATRYEQPLEVVGTTIIRAASYLDGLLPSRPTTHTYIFPADVITQQTLQPVVTQDPVWGPQMIDSLKALPTLSIVTAEAIQVEGEFATSAELIWPDGSAGFQVDAGIEVFGGTAVSFPKRSLRLSFKNIYGPSTFEYDVFDDPNGVQAFDQLLLRPGSHDTPFWNGAVGDGNYIRNRWTNDRQLEMGQPAPRGRFVQLYLNGAYWGQYQLLERPNAAFMAANFGGDRSDYDALNAGTAIDGDDVAWNALLDSLDEGYEAVKQYLDVVNFADYVLLEFYGGNTIDWRSDANWMAARKRESGAGFQFFAWDSDLILRTGAESDIVNFGGPGFLNTLTGGVMQYPEFRRLLAERAQLYFFGDGMFTDQSLRDQMDAFVDKLQVSVIAETARWGSGIYTPDTWRAAVEWIKETYAPANGPSRAATVIEQLRHAGLFPLSDQPSFLVIGEPVAGEVAVGDELTMSAPEGSIYYTLDGSDPWMNFPSLTYTPLVAESSMARVLVPTDGSLRNDWQASDFDDSAWMVGSNGVGYDETGELTSLIRLDIQDQMKDVNSTAYLRLPFQVTDPAQFDSLEFSVRYDDGFIAYLNGVEVARRNAPASVAWNSRARTAHANVEAIEFETFNLSRELQLLNAGENVLAIHALNTESTNVDMLITPMLKAGVVTEPGLAPTAQQYSGPITVPPGAHIKARTLWGDQWSTLREAAVDTKPFPLRVSEVMYHPADPTDSEIAAGFSDDTDFEFIELVNISDTAIDLTDVRFIRTTNGGQQQGIDFAFGRGQQLGANSRILIVEDVRAFALRYGNQLPVAGEWMGALSNNTEQITLMVEDQILLQFTYDDAWHPATDGGGASLEIVDETSSEFELWNQRSGWQPSTVLGGTPGRSSAMERIVGDSNGDGRFDSEDLILVSQIDEYEDGVNDNSTFEEGDWNGDGDFTSADLVLAFRLGHYAAMAPAKALDRQAVAAARLPQGKLDADRAADTFFGSPSSSTEQRAVERSLAARDLLFEGLAEADLRGSRHRLAAEGLERIGPE